MEEAIIQASNLKFDLNNYANINLLKVFSKIFEQIILEIVSSKNLNFYQIWLPKEILDDPRRNSNHVQLNYNKFLERSWCNSTYRKFSTVAKPVEVKENQPTPTS